jgi:putative DNA primase/helicase
MTPEHTIHDNDPAGQSTGQTIPPKPRALPVIPENIPAELKARPQWIVWRYEWNGKKWDKPPRSVATGKLASSTDASTWGTFEEALAGYQPGDYDGIGYVFSPDDPYTGIDLDHCLEAETGNLDPDAFAIVQRLNSYTEYSPSGVGLHTIPRAKLPGLGHKKPWIEVYDCGRYFTCTGQHIKGTPLTINDSQEVVAALYEEIWGTTPAPRHSKISRPSPNGQRYSPPLTDEQVLTLARQATNGAKFVRLWSGDTSAYAFSNPDGTRNEGRSEADQALCGCLGFYTQDEDQIDRLIRQSGLMRHKWAHRGDYRNVTIRQGIDIHTEYWTGTAPSSNGQPHDEYKSSEDGDDQHAQEPSPPADRPSPKAFFRKKTFIPKRLGDYLLTQHRIKYAAKMLWVYQNGVYVADGERILAAAAQQLLGEERRQNRIEESLRYIEVATYAEMPPPDLHYINLLNGRLEWSTGTLYAHTPDVFSVIQLPLRYDAEATCPTFDCYVETTLDADVIPLVEEIMGHLLIPDTRYEKAVMLTGEGENGKSVFIDTLTALLGSQHVSNVALQDLEENRFRVAELFGKLGNFFADLDPRALKSSSIFKTLVTGDEIEAERKFKDPFKFRNVARLVFSANKIPDSSDRTHAFYRRWHVIPFTRTFTGENRDPDLRAKLVCELSGILNRALKGLRRLYEQKEFTVPQAVKDALGNYERQNDSLATFIEEAVDRGPTFSVTKQRFYRCYCRWCDLYRLRPVSQKELSPRLYKLVPELDEARLDGRGVRVNKGPWRWIGIKPIEDGPEDDE